MPQAVDFKMLELAYPALWWTFTTNVRKLVEAYCTHATADAAFSERVAMACHELLENAVKYSRDHDALVSCRVEAADQVLTVTVGNESTAINIEILRSEFSVVQDGEPLDVYLLKMQADDNVASRMGLTRIRYEGEAQLALAIEREEVKVVATFQMPARADQTWLAEGPSAIA